MSLKKCNHPRCAPVFHTGDGRDYYAECSTCDVVTERSYRPGSWAEYVQARNNITDWPSRSITAKEGS
jgi:hypothetical protein